MGLAGGELLLEVTKTEVPRGFRLVGELDASNVGLLSDVLEPEIRKGGNITLDLAGLAFMDSSGIQVLVSTAQGLHGSGRLVLLSPGELVKRVLSLIPMEKMANVDIVDDLD
jgi:anti-anti-sigma factor